MENFLVASISSEALSSAAAVVALTTGVIGGAARYTAVLRGRSEYVVERATAIGFFVGLGFTALVLVSEYAA
jgi:hypothetical protein